MTARAPSDVEKKLLQAALVAPKQELTAKECAEIVPDERIRLDALNFLLSVELFKTLQTPKGVLSFRAISKSEYQITEGLQPHIATSANEGTWTKQLKTKTNLHQSIIDRCLKTLVQKQLIKRVHSVQHHTRKMFMLAHLEPSVALTGGPWYTDNELDTEFIRLLKTACLQFIRDRSVPKRQADGNAKHLYPVSSPPNYPSASDVQIFLRKSRITTTELFVEHVEMLLNVLILDGAIEKIPSFDGLLWTSNSLDDSGSDDEEERSRKTKQKYDDDTVDEDRKHRKAKRKYGDDTNDEARQRAKRKHDDHTDDEVSRSRKRVESVSDVDHRKRKRRRRDLCRDDSSADDSRGGEESSRRKHSRRSKGKRRAVVASSDSEADFGSESDSDRRKANIPAAAGNIARELAGISPYVYRAIGEECLSFGFSQAPCVPCPSFSFCKDGGPVNPGGCVYYDSWCAAPTIS